MKALQKLRALLAGATAGPWETTAEPHANAGRFNRPPSDAVRLLGPRIRPVGRSKYMHKPDADLICLLRNCADELLAVVEAAARYRGRTDVCDDGGAEAAYDDMVESLSALEKKLEACDE